MEENNSDINISADMTKAQSDTFTFVITIKGVFDLDVIFEGGW